ncbi:phosphoribosylglycinamide formyltransferase [Jatrophihabitans telluris]|uniref:Phosphoribosylglycinamide formyltransferase n=1 Tax=Jatrophihabitans telluris TaxID=2038343 RepID=A0ABY4QY76_9ACTN|nr:phosphoribosylglycinamide formyltransferase [Jatrophihabitans telluris]UQX88273.1 phosphoribosylglycinamide formyltransferase [Jatrophihabitans telluris]
MNDRPDRVSVAVLVSGAGSNLRALHAASLTADSPFRIVLVISNNSGSGGLAYAADHAIPTLHVSGRTHPDPGALDAELVRQLQAHQIELIVTAGYMKKVGPRVLAEYAGRILNIHPSLLPAHGGPGMYGAAVHRAVLAAGDRLSGPSVHLVTDEYDEGEIIGHQEVPVLDGDTPETLAARVLVAEHELLPMVVTELSRRLRR